MKAKPSAKTPMMTQYDAVKEKFPDSILFFRMGDFYEMFREDAVTASKVLGIALTKRGRNTGNEVDMCGVPHHSHKQYMLKLIKAGYKVAICDQLEDPALAKGLVKRGVTRVISPGTMVDDEELPDASNNFISAVYGDDGQFFIASADISTGEVFLSSSPEHSLVDVLYSFQPKEILSDAPIRYEHCSISVRQALSPSKAASQISEIYKVRSEKNIGIDDPRLAVAFMMIACYVKDAMLDISFTRPKVINTDNYLIIDSTAARTLELADSVSGDSLFSVINYTKTPMGKRLLKRVLLVPSQDVSVINRRLDSVEFFVNNWQLTTELEKLLKSVHDTERIINRISSRRVNPREVVWLRDSIDELPRIGDMLEGTGSHIAAELTGGLRDCGHIADIINGAILDEPSTALREGGIIKEGYNKEVDGLRYVKNNGRRMIAAMEAELKQSTAINQLKVSYNKVFGYYIEVSKANAPKVPSSFERKQTLVNAERFVTPELKELENTIMNAEERLAELEYDLFVSLRDMVAENADILRLASANTAQLDVYLGLARAATVRGYCRPVVDISDTIEIADVRHPVVEVNEKEPYVSSDVKLDGGENRMMLITGPNMAGKSTYMRAVALAVIMAHAGSFVPASNARIGVLDRIFTRVGAGDNISRGESTFMVEMVECANILAHATDKSLIVLDEIGRGTATYDGVSIAWAVTEYILQMIGAKTLFATHYHELTDIASAGSGASNYTVSVKDIGGEIRFLRKVIPGSADKSYGIYVAQLAGLPEKVIKRAEEVLDDLESMDAPAALGHGRPQEVVVRPMLVFDEDHPAVERLKALDINTLTPISALNIISELKAMAEDD